MAMMALSRGWRSRGTAGDRHEWPRTEFDTQVAKAALFAAQVLRRDLIVAGRKDGVEEVTRFVASLMPDTGTNLTPSPGSPQCQSGPEPASE